MAFTEGSSDGALNGTTEVELVAAPSGSDRKLVRNVIFYNADDAPVTITLRFKNGGSTRVLATFTLAVGDSYIYGGNQGEILILDSTSKSLAAVMSGAASSTNPDWVANYSTVN